MIPTLRHQIAVLVIVVIGLAAVPAKPGTGSVKKTARTPRFAFDSFWPKEEGHFGNLGNWMLGSAGGIAIDPATDHVWLLQRPLTLDKYETWAAQTPPLGPCCAPAPPVLEFDSAGHFIQGWGGPGSGYDWPEVECGIRIDYRGNVWITGSGKKDHQVLKFTKSGKFLLQIGHPGQSRGSNDTQNLNEPTNTAVYQQTNEVFVADGYVNRRVIVFDADSGAYKRHWGAYGKNPVDLELRTRRFPAPVPGDLPIPSDSDPPPQQFDLVRDILISYDGLIYVADRSNNRVQVFKPDGSFIKERFIARSNPGPVGTALALAASPDAEQRFLYVLGGDEKIRILKRDTLDIIGQFGRMGHFPGQLFQASAIAVDAKGNLYIPQGGTIGRVVQKFALKGYSSPYFE